MPKKKKNKEIEALKTEIKELKDDLSWGSAHPESFLDKFEGILIKIVEKLEKLMNG